LTGARSPSSKPKPALRLHVDIVIGENAGRVLVLLVPDRIREVLDEIARRARH